MTIVCKNNDLVNYDNIYAIRRCGKYIQAYPIQGMPITLGEYSHEIIAENVLSEMVEFIKETCYSNIINNLGIIEKNQEVFFMPYEDSDINA